MYIKLLFTLSIFMTFLKRAKRAIVGTILATSFLYPISTATTEPTQQVQLSEEQKAFLWILHLMQEEAQKTPEQKQREAEITEEVYKDLRQAWHIIRAFHQTGRCVSCGACERACPTDVKMTYLTDMLNDDMLELYEFEAGLSEDRQPPFAAFSLDDRMRFVR